MSNFLSKIKNYNVISNAIIEVHIQHDLSILKITLRLKKYFMNNLVQLSLPGHKKNYNIVKRNHISLFFTFQYSHCVHCNLCLIWIIYYFYIYTTKGGITIEY